MGDLMVFLGVKRIDRISNAQAGELFGWVECDISNRLFKCE